MTFSFALTKAFIHFRSLRTSLNSSLTFQIVRMRKDCAVDPFPTCSPKNIAKTICAKKKKEATKVKTSSTNPECCIDPCKDAYPRFDSLFYKPSDKGNRNYERTWMECPPPKKVEKKICKYIKYEPQQPVSRRKFNIGKKVTACGRARLDRTLMKCTEEKKEGKCPRFTLKFCKNVRVPPKCIKLRKPSDCKKVCTPYPSFSECKSPKIRPKRPSECECLAAVSLCEVWREFNKQLHKNSRT